jgi:GNAT superfamily N-acetyltransferase
MSTLDADALRRFHEGLSDRTVYLRFFSPHPHLSDSEVAQFTDVDHVSREALVALCDNDIVGVARFDALPTARNEAEVAFVVTDACQGQGVGRRLLVELIEAACALGITTLVAEVLPANGRMMDLLMRAGRPVVKEHGDGVVVLRLLLGSDDEAGSRSVRPS